MKKNNIEARLHNLQKYQTKNLINEIKKALAPFGYFNPTVTVKLRQIAGNKIMVFTINKGLPVRIKKINIEIIGEGRNNQEIQRAVYCFSVKINEIFKN